MQLPHIQAQSHIQSDLIGSDRLAGELEVRAKKLEEAAAPVTVQVLALENKLKVSERLCDLLQRDALRQKQVCFSIVGTSLFLYWTVVPRHIGAAFKQEHMRRMKTFRHRVAK